MKRTELIRVIREEVQRLNESNKYEPDLFRLATMGGYYESPVRSGKIYHFISKDFSKENWCRLKFRVYDKVNETGGFLLDVILSGNMDELLYELDNIALKPKRTYGSLITIQRKIDNNVPDKFQYRKMSKQKEWV